MKTEEPSNKRRKIYKADFKPGFIRSVKVTNFTTYSSAEFNLSPTLNMIIGPNGSGKSTLVASICIGLGGKVDLIKRKNMKSMIKTGTDRATVEITLENFDNKPPITIRREFTARESSWSINGRRSTETAVKELRKKFNIQLDNLCHFLPQERVAEFAGLSPEKLLIETERTLGDGHLLEMHEELKDRDATSQELDRKIKDLSSRLEQLHKQRAELEVEAKKYEEYESKSKEIGNYKLLIPYAQLADHEHELKDIKQKSRDAKIAIKEFSSRRDGLDSEVEKADSELTRVNSKLAKEDAAFTKYKKKIEECKKNKEKILEAIKEAHIEISTLSTRAEKKKEELLKIRADLEKYEARKESYGEVDEDIITDLSKRAKEKRQEQNELENQIREASGPRKTIEYDINMLRKKFAAESQKLETKDKLEIFASSGYRNKIRDEMFDIVKRLRKQPDLNGRFFEAPILSCEVTDPRLAPAVEKAIDNMTLFSITCVSQSDLEKLKTFTKNHGKNVPLRRTDTTHRPASLLPVSRIKELGFDGYLADFIQGPTAVLGMLYDVSKLHNVPVSRAPLTTEQINRLTQAGNAFPFAKFISGETLYNIQRSRYGSRKSFYITEVIGRANYFSTQGMSEEAKAAIKRELKSTEDKIKDKKAELEKILEAHSELMAKLSDLKAEYNDIKHEGEKLMQRKQHIAKVSGAIEGLQKEEKRLERQATRDYSDKIKKYEGRIAEYYSELGRVTVELTTVIHEQAKQGSIVKLITFEQLHFRNRKEIAQRLVSEAQSRMQELRTQYERYKAEYDRLKNSETVAKIREQSESYTDEMREILTEIAREYINNGNFTEENIREKIKHLEDEISIMTTADHSSIDTLKQKLRDIEAAEYDLPRLENEKERIDNVIETIQSKWEPELTNLVNRISLAFNKRFSKVASDGQVQLAKSDRFKDWKLEILVKFRQESELKVLDNQSQSGGERAVSTIFFVMSLQGLTDAPFRIVDEINQGMDPKNEKMAHRYLVHTACQNSQSQYFLVTPKLLTGLYYHPDMVVHCIFTGPLIEGNEKKHDDDFGFLDFVDRAAAGLAV
ncbi:SMC5 [[Candida] subhashii]|uniref:Structural maintenance of chromosomes protein 5 n=1 Tax=[Candida] subhashii TaxID=561895 RepID=A0A8J5UZA7_9ASCO|nr:SMC5 [[Candida] subhashii]KAG7663454.1 SMC5 [[Candida] subhashii]